MTIDGVTPVMIRRVLLWLCLLLLWIIAPTAAQTEPSTITTILNGNYRVDVPATWTISRVADVTLFRSPTENLVGYLSAGPPTKFDGETPLEMLQVFLAGLSDDALPYDDPQTLDDVEGLSGVRAYSQIEDDRAGVIYVVSIDDFILFARLSTPADSLTDLEPRLLRIIESARTGENVPNDYPLDVTPLLLTTVATGGYTFSHPASWEITDSDDPGPGFVLFAEQPAGVSGFIAAFVPGTRYNATTPADILAEDNDLLNQENPEAQPFTDIESFALNGIPAARGYRDTPDSNQREILMVTLRDGLIFMLLGIAEPDLLTDREPVLRAVLASLRVSQSDVDPAIGFINIPQNLDLRRTFATEDGRFAFRYPETWFVQRRDAIVVLSRTETYSTPVPSTGEIIISMAILESLPDIGLRYSPALLLEVLIQGDENDLPWRDIETLRIGPWRAAITSLDSPDSLDWAQIALELDRDAQIYLRVNVLAAPGELPLFSDILLTVLESVRFAGS